MADLLFIALMVGFSLLSLGFVNLANYLMESEE